MTLRVSIPSLDVFRRALDRMVEDGRRHAASLIPQTAGAGDLERECVIGRETGPVDVRSIFPEFPVDVPMPGGIRLPPVDVDAHEFGAPGRIPARPLKASDFKIEFRDSDGGSLDLGEGLSDADLSIRCPGILRKPAAHAVVHTIYAAGGGGSGAPREVGSTVRISGVTPGIDGAYRVAKVGADGRPTEMTRIPDAPPQPPFDPVRAWAEVGMAWMRCAYITAEIPWQLALYQRVAVGL